MMDPILVVALLALLVAVRWPHIEPVTTHADSDGHVRVTHFFPYLPRTKSGHVEIGYCKRYRFRHWLLTGLSRASDAKFACFSVHRIWWYSKLSGNIFRFDASGIISKKFFHFLWRDVVLGSVLKRIAVFFPLKPVLAAISSCHVRLTAALDRAISSFSAVSIIHFNSLGVAIAAPLYHSLRYSQHENRTA